MSLDTTISDPVTRDQTRVNDEGAMSVVIHPHPPDFDATDYYPYRAFFTNSAGSSDMAVDGSTTKAVFSLDAQKNKDLWIKTLSMRIGATGTVNLSTFGDAAALTNGVSLNYLNANIGTVVIADELKTNLDLIRLGVSTSAFGATTSAYKLNIAGASAQDTYLPVIDMQDVFGFPFGVRLRKGSTDKLTIEVQDDLSGIETFNLIAYGIQINVES